MTGRSALLTIPKKFLLAHVEKAGCVPTYGRNAHNRCENQRSTHEIHVDDALPEDGL